MPSATETHHPDHAVQHICCIGAGYVGGPSCAVLADQCPDVVVTVVDVDADRIQRWNHGPRLPVFEPGLDAVVARCRNRNLFFSTDVDTAIARADIIFVSVNTPTKSSGLGAGMAADLRYIEAATRTIVKAATRSKIIVEKSTVPCRTAEKIEMILKACTNPEISFEILSNPEFLAEGTAVQDLLEPDRILIGGRQTESGLRAQGVLADIYARWIPRSKIILTNLWSSELSKLVPCTTSVSS